MNDIQLIGVRFIKSGVVSGAMYTYGVYKSAKIERGDFVRASTGSIAMVVETEGLKPPVNKQLRTVKDIYRPIPLMGPSEEELAKFSGNSQIREQINRLEHELKRLQKLVNS